MAFPSLEAKRDIAVLFANTQREALKLKRQSQQLRDATAARDVPMSRLVNSATQLGVMRAAFVETRDAPGVATYASANLGIADVVAELNAVIAAIDSTIAWIVANAPTNGGGFLAIETLNADGTTTKRMAATAQTAGLRTELDALILTID